MKPALESTSIEKFRVLGIPVCAINLKLAAENISDLAMQSQGSQFVFVREVASLMQAVEEPQLRALHESASFVVPDGMPLVWLGRLKGHKAIGRVAGADLVDELCRLSIGRQQSHFFYGGKPQVAEEMAEALARRYPGLKVVGVFSPPVEEIGPQYDLAYDSEGIRRLNDAAPDFIWVGLSSPKQEYWMAKAAPHLIKGVMLGVGAAFDFHSGRVRRAPRWMQISGLEWLHRLASEPKRLWRRYLILAPTFAIRVTFEASKGFFPALNRG